eukprot:Nitzschia sp. Nitz4//scaffold3_size479765//229529//231732//NITZ4_000096-RA/size479765-augustus-gene-1.568-mRNA-1//1//CDS//3329550746//9266//frame0
MLAAVHPVTSDIHTTPKHNPTMADADQLNDGSSDDEGARANSKGKSRRELPAGAVAILKAWLLSPEHFTHPYPTPQDQVMLMQKTGIDKRQLKNWFTNARRRIWKPLLRRQLEQGNLAGNPTGAPNGAAVPGVVPGLMVPGMPRRDDSVVYQQAVQHAQAPEVQQQHQQQVQVDQYGNHMYAQQPQVAHAAPMAQQQYYDPNAQLANLPQGRVMHAAPSIGSLPPMNPSGSTQQLSKSDSHAVLMELFARDQDLVRQATEAAGQKKTDHDTSHGSTGAAPVPGQPSTSSQHPMKTLSQARAGNSSSLTSWPHFSSVSSLNNLGTMPGVRSITSLSGADLAKQGPVNTVGNLAQVKSTESMGKSDSYAFLEVFFGDRSSNNLSQMWGNNSGRGVKRDREEDNDVGLSLDDEASPSMSHSRKDHSNGVHSGNSDSMSNPFGMDKNNGESTDTLKGAFDDAMAARGLISVSRSCEKLTDLVLPTKVQRTLSQEYQGQQHHQQPVQHQTMHQQSHMQQSMQHHSQVHQAPSSHGHQSYTQYQYSPAPADNNLMGSSDNRQYPGQHPGQQMHSQSSQERRSSYSSNPTDANASVEVPSATKCAICHQTNVDTQLRPCGHMFHERCLKPSLQAPIGPPKCPVDHIPIQSALLAIPTEEGGSLRSTQQHSWNLAPVSSAPAYSTESRH